MASAALVGWRNDRRARLDELLAAHQQVGGTGPGRRWRTEQLNWALILRVAAEFQGFSRDLHDEAADCFAARTGGANAALVAVVRERLSAGRKLDSGNANPGNLGSDFGRLGLRLWPELTSRYARAERWRVTIDALNTARNAIAHDDRAALARLEADGWRLAQLETTRRFRTAADNLVAGMDTVVGGYLDGLLGGGAPW